MEADVTTILGYVLKCNYNLPYNATSKPDVERELPDGLMSRWSLYRLLQSSMEMFGSDRACLLRAVCEVAETPFAESHGLLGELLNVLLKPSTTWEQYEVEEDHAYHRAEVIGREHKNACVSAFSECSRSPLEYFSV